MAVVSSYFIDLLSREGTPGQCPKEELGEWVNYGDLHGNALVLLAVCHYFGIANVTPSAYKTFKPIYFLQAEQKRDADAAAIREFANMESFVNEVLVGIKGVPGKKLRLLGDLVCDRGANDYYTLAFISALINDGVSLEILLSNHDILFIAWIESLLHNEPIRKSWRELGDNAGISLKRLDAVIARDNELKNAIFKMYDQYKSALKLLSYDYDKHNNFVLYSHAHLDERDLPAMLEGLALRSRLISDEYRVQVIAWGKFLEISDKEISIEDTKHLIDVINAIFNLHVSNNNLTEIYYKEAEDLKKAGIPQLISDPIISPLHYAIWNRRNLDERSSFNKPKNTRIINAHGHHTYVDRNDEPKPHKYTYPLDNDIGKSIEGRYFYACWQSKVTVLMSYATPQPAAQAAQSEEHAAHPRPKRRR